MNDLEGALERDDAERIRRLTEALTQTSHKLAQSMYRQASPSGEGQYAGGRQHTRGPSRSGSVDEVVDAEYQEVA